MKDSTADDKKDWEKLIPVGGGGTGVVEPHASRCKNCEFAQDIARDALAKIERLENELKEKRELVAKAMEMVEKCVRRM